MKTTRCIKATSCVFSVVIASPRRGRSNLAEILRSGFLPPFRVAQDDSLDVILPLNLSGRQIQRLPSILQDCKIAGLRREAPKNLQVNLLCFYWGSSQ